MRFILTVFILYTLVACNAHSKNVAHPKAGVIEIPHGGFFKSPTIDVYLKGKGPFKFMLDTAATNSVISPKLAQELGVQADKKSPKASTLLIDKIRYSYFSEMTNIYLGKNKTMRRSRMVIAPLNLNNKRDGIIGLSTIFDAKIVNDPKNAQLNIILNQNNAECDPLKTKSKCNFSYYDMPKIKVKLGHEKFELLLDTGFEGGSSFILFKNNFTNKIWEKYNHVFKVKRNKAISDLPYGHIFTHDFTFNETKGCFADFYIKHPKDKSPRMMESLGTLGWTVIKKVAFEYDVKTRKLSYPQGICPFKKINTNGIGGMRFIGDGDQAYIQNLRVGSPADLAGLVNNDILERVHLADSTVIETLKEEFANRLDDIIFAPEGTVTKFDVIRDGQIVTIPVISKEPKFLDLKNID